jgi:hypothetical protein
MYHYERVIKSLKLNENSYRFSQMYWEVYFFAEILMMPFYAGNYKKDEKKKAWVTTFEHCVGFRKFL